MMTKARWVGMLSPVGTRLGVPAWLPWLWSAATLLSTAQIFWRHSLEGRSPALGATLAANLVAWLPWLGLAPLALWLARRFDLRQGLSRSLPIHVFAAALVAALFVGYLTGFRFFYLQDIPGPWTWSSVSAVYAEEAGAHFLASFVLFGALVLAVSLRRTPAERPVPIPRREQVVLERSLGRVQVIEPEQIRWVEAAGNYVSVHLGDRTVLLRRTISSFETELADQQVVRIHRSTLVSLRQIAEVRRASHGEAWAVLQDGTRLKVSRTYRPRLRDLLA